MLFQRRSQRRAQRPPVYECTTCASRQAHESRQHFLRLSVRQRSTPGGKCRNTRKKRHRGEPGRTRDTVPVGILPRSGLRRKFIWVGGVLRHLQSRGDRAKGRAGSRRRLASCSDVCVIGVRSRLVRRRGSTPGLTSRRRGGDRRRGGPRLGLSVMTACSSVIYP